MLRCSVVRLCGALSHIADRTIVQKDYQKIEADRKVLKEQNKRRQEFERYPLRYQLLECRPGLPLALTKLKYLLACRRTHPDAGGDAESFLRVSLAYQDVMKDYGVETVDNQVVNLGNYQSDDHEAQNYLEARASITSYIPISTLEDHIKQIEEIEGRLGGDLSEKLSSNRDETMWLLEDIEEVMEQTGLKTVRVKVLEDGKVKLSDTLSLTDGTETPLFLAEGETQKVDSHSKEPEARTTAEASSDSAPKDNSTASENVETGEKSKGGENTAIYEAEVSRSDVEVLNAKNSVQERTDVAGLAARTATEVMKNTEESKQMRLESSVLYVLLMSILVLVYVYIEGAMRAKRQEKSRPEMMEHITSDTMLPWWGNDAEYESQVKRIFVEEWRKARASSRRSQTFQDGVARESLDDKTKKDMDLQIFTVTAEKLRAMRENAEQNPRH